MNTNDPPESFSLMTRAEPPLAADERSAIRPPSAHQLVEHAIPPPIDRPTVGLDQAKTSLVRAI